MHQTRKNEPQLVEKSKKLQTRLQRGTQGKGKTNKNPITKQQKSGKEYKSLKIKDKIALICFF